MTNADALRHINMLSVGAMLAAAQLLCAGHVARMQNNRLSKEGFCGELKSGKRHSSGPKLHFRETFKRHLS